jgi:hypothetical protein
MIEAGGELSKENHKADTIFMKERVLSANVFLMRWKEGLQRVWKKLAKVMEELQGMEGWRSRLRRLDGERRI